MCDISNGNIQSVSPAPHYALWIALKALKCRYDKLQKIVQIHDESVNNNIKRDSDTLNLLRTIEVLERQKLQLSHHIFQLASINRDLHDEIEGLNKENFMLKSKLDESQIDGSVTETQEDPEEKEEAKRLDSVSDDEDSDIVILSDEESIDNVSLQQFDIENEMSKILGKLKTEKSMLESFQKDILSVLSEIKISDSTSKNQKDDDLKNDNTEKGFEIGNENMTQKKLNSYEICPNCHHIMLNNVDEADKEMLFKSYEIISCRCK